MPATDAGWRAWSGAEWTEDIRATLDAAVGLSLDYDGTIEEDWTAAIGQIAADADDGYQLAVDALDPARARGAALDAAVAPIVYRRPATKSRYTVEAVGTGTVPDGTLYQDDDDQVWGVVDGGGAVTAGSVLVIEAQTAGVVTLSQGSPSTLVPLSALASPSDLTYTPGDAYDVGADMETDSALRRRWSLSLGRPRCPTAPGIRRTLLSLTWVTAVSTVRTGPGTLAIYVVPEPVGTDRIDALGAAIYSCIGAATLTTGTDDVTVTGADGYPVTVYYTPGTTQAVAVVLTVVLDTGIALASVQDAIEGAIEGVFGALEVGDILRRLEVLGALASVDGVVGFGACTLDGGTSDVTPATSTTLLTLGTLTVTT